MINIVARPKSIFTFKNIQSNNRYFQIFDIYSGLPSTIPMDFITFLQYIGIRHKKNINCIFGYFNQLMINGIITNCSLKLSNLKRFEQIVFRNESLDTKNLLSNPIKLDYLNDFDSYIFYDEFVDSDSFLRNEINEKLIQLFESSLEFEVFYEKYLGFIKPINPNMPRPVDYYNSVSHTSNLLSSYNNKIEHIVAKCIEKHSLMVNNKEFLNKSFDKNFIYKHKEAVVDFYASLGSFNLIRLDAIPHWIRNESEIEKLFTDFGFESFLPQRTIVYKIYSVSEIKLKSFDEPKYLRQFINYFSFSAYNPRKLLGLELLKLNIIQLHELLHQCHCLLPELINFVDQWENFLQPMIYSGNIKQFSNAMLNSMSSLIFLDFFGKQDYHAFNKQGRLIMEEGFYDYYYSNVQDLYAVSYHDLYQVCLKFEPQTEIISEKKLNQNMFLEEPLITSKDLLEFPKNDFCWQQKEMLFKKIVLIFNSNKISQKRVFKSHFVWTEFEIITKFKKILQTLNTTDDDYQNWEAFNKELTSLSCLKSKEINVSVSKNEKDLTLNHTDSVKAFVLDFNQFVLENKLTENKNESDSLNYNSTNYNVSDNNEFIKNNESEDDLPF